jgi:hypothetical protein
VRSWAVGVDAKLDLDVRLVHAVVLAVEGLLVLAVDLDA